MDKRFAGVNFFLSFPFTVQTADNSHCSVSPASAFAIATAAAGHGSPPGEGCAGHSQGPKGWTLLQNTPLCSPEQMLGSEMGLGAAWSSGKWIFKELGILKDLFQLCWLVS